MQPPAAEESVCLFDPQITDLFRCGPTSPKGCVRAEQIRGSIWEIRVVAERWGIETRGGAKREPRRTRRAAHLCIGFSHSSYDWSREYASTNGPNEPGARYERPRGMLLAVRANGDGGERGGEAGEEADGEERPSSVDKHLRYVQ